MTAQAIPRSADVVVVGAGLSGLVAASALTRADVRQVVVLEARGRPGGRVSEFVAPNGRRLEAGGEFLAPHMASLVELAAEHDLALDRLPSEGKLVRVVDGERLVEETPFESDPAAAAAYERAAAGLDQLAAQVPIESPWEAPTARELDSRTLAWWIEAKVPDGASRGGLAAEFNYCGADFFELSLLHALWTIRCMGGWEAWTEGQTHRLRAGASALVERLAAPLGERLVLEAPVRRVEQERAGVVVRTDRCVVRARAAIVALAPALCGRIAWDPPLSPARDRLQGRFLQGHGVKFLAVYEEPWWRARGLAGVGTGLPPVSLLVDVSPQDGGEGILLGQAPITGPLAAAHSRALADPDSAKALFLEQAATYLGPEAGEAQETYVFSWVGDPWSSGCAAGLPPGVLSTVGSALREPIGSIVWAGAETGMPQNDWLEGAVSAGSRAAAEALELLGGER